MKKALLAAAAILAISSQAQAYDRNSVLFGLGADTLRQDQEGDRTVGGRVEWRGSAFNNVFGVKNISPLAGVELNGKGSVYAYGGFLYDWNFYDKWHLVPNLAMGAYEHGNGKDLGGWFEFHDAIELDYSIDDISRVGVSLAHMSSAGIEHPNPGKESLMAIYSTAY